MSGTSEISVVVRFRIPKDAYDTVVRRVEKGHDTISDYLRDRLLFGLKLGKYDRRKK